VPQKYLLLLDQTTLLHFRSSIDRPLNLPQYPCSKGRKRIAFDSNVHKIAIFSDELENVKQLHFSLQKFESDNIEFETKCSDLHNKSPCEF
jgi:hypothetical protein